MFDREPRLPMLVPINSSDYHPANDRDVRVCRDQLTANLLPAFNFVRGSLEIAQHNQRTCYDKHRKGIHFELGDLVMIATTEGSALGKWEAPKSDPRWKMKLLLTIVFSTLLLFLFDYSQSQTCSKTQECKNKACCSKYGNCGYGPDFCKKDQCLSNCQSKAECGKYGVKEKCPLNVCCSEFGFCGTTNDFCDKPKKKCQNNCGNKTLPKCSSSNEKNLIVLGYYASWAAYRTCQKFTPRNIDPRVYTHLNYAFGNISNGLLVNPSIKEEEENIKDFVGLKKINTNLKVLISVGGWLFNDPGPTRTEFHKLALTQASRKRFITSCMDFFKKYGFDGIDIDWEYPTAEDRGGSPEDSENYVKLVKEMRQVFGNNYLITIAAPASYWYLRHFKIGEMSKSLDFINCMTYDIHGVWNEHIESLGPYVKSHTNIKEITEALQLFLRDGVNTNKLVLGLGYYGRSFQLETSSCSKVGCKFKEAAKEGRCTKAAGVLAWFEIQEIIDTKGGVVKPILDKDSMSKILTFDNDQWVAYDDEETLALRRKYAAENCLKG
ncbi:unnamed protein product [Didymodactylos carnosus]|uniref:Chitinase n=1 Tax=Didymodactylos carnosus TaxID=1234261 RepID=A0A8S2DT12_9BILA|nr:unnamed protein product [Didymodactylos carnosus]CAF3764479.1 unnamed protein product [Didymodactylos carnosus]